MKAVSGYTDSFELPHPKTADFVPALLKSSNPVTPNEWVFCSLTSDWPAFRLATTSSGYVGAAVPIPKNPLFVNVSCSVATPPVLDEIWNRLMLLSPSLPTIANFAPGVDVPRPKFPAAVNAELIDPLGP